MGGPTAEDGRAPHPGRSPLDTSVATAVGGFLAEFFDQRCAAARADGAGWLDGADGVDGEFDTEVVELLREFTLTGGKRIRPTFAWWGWRAAGKPPDGAPAHAALRAAAALELLHSCALIQDDVMDGSMLRRGQPALHATLEDEHRRRRWAGSARRYGESVAVLAGDLALIWADDMFDEALDALPVRERARAPWQRMRTELITGQFLDLRAQAARAESPAAALRTDQLKTAAYSAERPLHLGAALAGADDGLVEALRGYGAEIGTAFQLRDDLIGLYGDPVVTGKPVGEDLREGKRTLLLALGIERAVQRGDTKAAAVLRASVGEPALTGDDIAQLSALLEELGARAAVEERISRLVADGLEHIRDTPMPGVALRALEKMASEATVRIR